MLVHILQVQPHIKIGCTPVRLTWEDHLSSLFHSEEFDELAPNTGLPVLVCCTFNELRGTFWLSDLVFSGPSDALGQSDNENLFRVLISILSLPPSIMSSKKIYLHTGLPVLVMNSQLLFPDWLAYSAGLPMLVYPHSHIRLMLDLVQAWQWRHRR